jgi:prepilin-type N-terminal cleavage/methylation domain-containing protein
MLASKKSELNAVLGAKAFTLVELVVVVGILAILISLVVPAASRVLPKAEQAGCMSRLHNLWVAFAPCATDGDGWPQLPANIQIGSSEEQQWWLATGSNRFGLKFTDWQCPTLQRYQHGSQTNTHIPVISYLPTLFDARPNTPNKWPSMPWFTEIGNVHGQGNLTVRSDGSIIPLLAQ